METQHTPKIVEAKDFLQKRLTWDEFLRPKDDAYVQNTSLDGKEYPGFASVKSAIIAWRKLGKPEGAVIVDFQYSDQSIGREYSNPKSRFAIFLPTPEITGGHLAVRVD